MLQWPMLLYFLSMVEWVVDASCPVVLKLQNRIKDGYNKAKEENAQIIIYGKQGHAEVKGLLGQTEGNAIVVNSVEEIDKIDLFIVSFKSFHSYRKINFYKGFKLMFRKYQG